MFNIDTFYGRFRRKYKSCKSKKDYKHLCKELLALCDAIDKIDENRWKIFAPMIGEEKYLQGLTLSVKMYLLEQNGVSCDVIHCEIDDDFDI